MPLSNPLQIKDYACISCAARANKKATLVAFLWSEWGDSNSRHPAPKAGALPTALHPDGGLGMENVIRRNTKDVAVEA